MKKLILVAGPAGIGKSHYCRSYSKTHQEENVHILSSDEIRKSMTHSYRAFLTDKNGARDMTPIFEAMVSQAKILAQNNANVTVMLDTTMLEDDRRLYFLDQLSEFEETELDLLKVHDYAICLQRNKQRDPEKWVPEAVIQDMVKNYFDPSKEVAKRFNRVRSIYVD